MMTTKRDGLQIGGVVVGALTVPKRDLDNVGLLGVGRIFDPASANPGDRFVSTLRDPEFPGAGVALMVPDLGIETVTVAFGGRHNAFVNQGLQDVLDAAYEDLDTAGDRISHIALAESTATVTAATTSIAPTGSSSIKTTANTSRTNQTVHADQTWTQADVSWAIAKIGLLSGNTADQVVNIIGGTGGSAPYNEPFTIDLTSIATWSLTMGIDVTATAS